MLYLATPPTAEREHLYRRHHIGLMYTANMSNSIGILDRVPYWAADTGCYSQGEAFNLDEYLAWLKARIPYADRCLFATAPDVVGDCVATWERSRAVLPLIRSMGFVAALVAQDGIEHTDIDWAAFDCLFIGGTTEWKLSEAARLLCKEAKARGKFVHVGRVNSEKRIDIIAGWDVDSADGTCLAFGPNINIKKLGSWLMKARQQQRFAA